MATERIQERRFVTRGQVPERAMPPVHAESLRQIPERIPSAEKLVSGQQVSLRSERPQIAERISSPSRDRAIPTPVATPEMRLATAQPAALVVGRRDKIPVPGISPSSPRVGFRPPRLRDGVLRVGDL